MSVILHLSVSGFASLMPCSRTPHRWVRQERRRDIQTWTTYGSSMESHGCISTTQTVKGCLGLLYHTLLYRGMKTSFFVIRNWNVREKCTGWLVSVAISMIEFRRMLRDVAGLSSRWWTVSASYTWKKRDFLCGKLSVTNLVWCVYINFP